jgi:hypothetical protein
MQDESMDARATRDEKRREYAALVGGADDPVAALSMLKHAGASPIDAIVTLRARFAMPTNEAKLALHDHPDWFAEARAAEALHDELEAQLDECLAAPTRYGGLARLRIWLRRRR